VSAWELLTRTDILEIISSDIIAKIGIGVIGFPISKYGLNLKRWNLGREHHD
jgi:hypothetical protein